MKPRYCHLLNDVQGKTKSARLLSEMFKKFAKSLGKIVIDIYKLDIGIFTGVIKMDLVSIIRWKSTFILMFPYVEKVSKNSFL